MKSLRFKIRDKGEADVYMLSILETRNRVMEALSTPNNLGSDNVVRILLDDLEPVVETLLAENREET
jgi:hypothetical protein